MFQNGAVFSLLMSKGHLRNTWAGSVWGSVDPTTLGQFELGESQLQVPGKQLKPTCNYSDPYIRGVIYRGG